MIEGFRNKMSNRFSGWLSFNFIIIDFEFSLKDSFKFTEICIHARGSKDSFICQFDQFRFMPSDNTISL